MTTMPLGGSKGGEGGGERMGSGGGTEVGREGRRERGERDWIIYFVHNSLSVMYLTFSLYEDLRQKEHLNVCVPCDC